MGLQLCAEETEDAFNKKHEENPRSKRETLGIERSEHVESKTIGKRWEMRKQS